MTFVKAYEELWDSRFIKQPIANIKTFPAEKLEEEVNRSWKLERNLSSKAPTPVQYHFLSRSSDPLLDSIIGREILCVKGRYLFARQDEYLHCMVYLPSGHLKTIWSSDKLSFSPQGFTRIRSTSYAEDGQEISVIIADGYKSLSTHYSK